MDSSTLSVPCGTKHSPDAILKAITKLPPFYPILDTSLLDRFGLPLVEAAETLLETGVQILQLRHKGHFSRELFEQAEQIAVLCTDAGALFVVNDRADMAALLGAGLHLGQDDLPPRDARRILPPGAMLGFSTHNEGQMRLAAAEPADYLAFGPVFPTTSKINPDAVVGIDELRRLRPLTTRPLVAIGGITRLNARQVLDAGADSLAVIGDLLPDLRSRAAEWLQVTGNRP